MGDVLIFAEHQAGHFPKTTLVAVHAGLDLAKKRGGKAIAVVAGDAPEAAAGEIAKYGVAKVIALAHPALKNYLADAHAQALAALAKKENAEFVLATATAIGKDLFPRLAARLGAPMASEITSIGDDHTFVRPTYAGNVMATVELDGPIKVLTVRGTAFDAAQPGDAVAPVEKQEAQIDTGALRMEFVSFNATKSDRPQLTEARIIVSGGRGLKSGENFKTVLEPLVDEMGAAMGASGAAVDAGFVPNDRRARGAHRSAHLVDQRLEHRLEVLARLETASARDDYPRLGQLRAIALGRVERNEFHLERARVDLGILLFDRRDRVARLGSVERGPAHRQNFDRPVELDRRHHVAGVGGANEGMVVANRGYLRRHRRAETRGQARKQVLADRGGSREHEFRIFLFRQRGKSLCVRVGEIVL